MRPSNLFSRTKAVWFGWALFFVGAHCLTAASATGLWVGEAVLNNVNETVVGINAANQTVAPDPSVATPVQSPAHLKVIVHVDGQGQARLLNSVAILNKATNPPAVFALVTDPSLYQNFSASGVGQRIASAGFDFGDLSLNQVLVLVASNAAYAAATGANPTNAANSVLQKVNVDIPYLAFVTSAGLSNAALIAASAAATAAVNVAVTNGSAQQVTAAALSAATNTIAIVTNRSLALSLQATNLLQDGRYVAAVDSISAAAANGASSTVNGGQTNLAQVNTAATSAALAALASAIAAPSAVSPGYAAFITTPIFQGSAVVAAGGAASGAAQAAGQSSGIVQNQANASALKALTDGGVFAAADGVVDHEVRLTGQFAPGSNLAGSIYLGAGHPTNPFRHRRHPDHTTGYPITRAISIQFDSATGTNAFLTAGFGVDRITGSYREEISGLHKPLGPNQNLGLITVGSIVLNRISSVATLNQ
jgi:hypothetical protein